ncbi:MAG: 16S rRNA (uracil(1498)-N(3))-methyltransferase [Patescibacteria group bacterium]|nr:16S rRNA (uracil(1498)-N(3))-methyltransferase [Patescibacteria group bacterium]
MRLHRFYIDEDIGDKTELTVCSAELVNQVRRVFRLKSGDSIVVFTGTGIDYECKIDFQKEKNTIDSDSFIHLIVLSSRPSRFTPTTHLYLCAALVKKDIFEWIVEKSAELGVTNVIPIVADRTEKKSLNHDRLKKIAIEASEQCGRGNVPTVHEPMRLPETVAFLKRENVSLLVFHTDGERFPAGQFAEKNQPLGVFIGPEGGWSDAELEMFHEEKAQVVTLGPQVLRAETAVVAALSMVVFG